MRKIPNLPLELLQKQTKLDLSVKKNREEFRKFLLQTIDVADLALAREKIPELSHWSDEEMIAFGHLYSENIYEISAFQDASRDGWLNMLALIDTLSYSIEDCLKAFHGYGIFPIDEIEGVYNAWLVNNEEAMKKVIWNLEYHDPKHYLAGLVKQDWSFSN